MDEENDCAKAHDEKVKKEVEKIRANLKDQLQAVKKQSEESIIECSTYLAERLQKLRHELDSKS